MAQQERAHATREAILQAAGVVFSNVSYSTAKLSDITTQSGVTQGALYFHFESKHALAVQVIKRQEELSHAIDAEVVGKNPRAVQLLMYSSLQLAQQLKSNAIVRAGIRLNSESSNFFPEYSQVPYTDWVDTCKMLLQAAIGEGDIVATISVNDYANLLIEGFTGPQIVSQVVSGWADFVERLDRFHQHLCLNLFVPERCDEINAMREQLKLRLAL